MRKRWSSAVVAAAVTMAGTAAHATGQWTRQSSGDGGRYYCTTSAFDIEMYPEQQTDDGPAPGQAVVELKASDAPYDPRGDVDIELILLKKPGTIALSEANFVFSEGGEAHFFGLDDYRVSVDGTPIPGGKSGTFEWDPADPSVWGKAITAGKRVKFEGFDENGAVKEVRNYDLSQLKSVMQAIASANWTC